MKKLEKNSIDETDGKILRTLLAESRTSFTDIAEVCKITVSAVRMRYKRLWREGVINGEIMQVNPNSFGFKCVCDIGIVATTGTEGKIRQLLEGKTYINHVIEFFGEYRLGAQVALHSTQELSGVMADIESIPCIKRADPLIWAETVNIDHAENLVINPLTDRDEKLFAPQHTPISSEQVELDDTDWQIAKTLSSNSRVPFTEIAKRLNVSPKNVIQRYKKLRNNVLTLSTITVDLKKLGYNAIAQVPIKLANKSKATDVYKKMLEIPNLIVAIRFIGQSDMIVMVAVKDFEDVFRTTGRIQRVPEIEKAEFFLSPPFPRWPQNIFAKLLWSK